MVVVHRTHTGRPPLNNPVHRPAPTADQKMEAPLPCRVHQVGAPDGRRADLMDLSKHSCPANDVVSATSTTA